MAGLACVVGNNQAEVGWLLSHTQKPFYFYIVFVKPF
jgi:hypothetical protein